MDVPADRDEGEPHPAGTEGASDTKKDGRNRSRGGRSWHERRSPWCQATPATGRPVAVAFSLALLLLGADRPRGSYGCGTKEDDRCEDFYLEKVPTQRVDAAKVDEFVRNHPNWFEGGDRGRFRFGGADPAGIRYRRPGGGNGLLRDFKTDRLEALARSFSVLRKDSAEAMRPVADFLERIKFAERVKNFTHPFRPRVAPHGTARSGCGTRTSTAPGCARRFAGYGATVRIHRRRSSSGGVAGKKKPRRGVVRSKPRDRTKVYVNVSDEEGRRRKVQQRHARLQTNGTEANNSSRVLETAEEMATDLAGRVTNLWKCVIGSHRNPQIRDVRYFLYTRRNVIEPEELSVDYDLIRNKSSAAKKMTFECAEMNPGDIDDFQRVSDRCRKIIRSNFLSLRAPTKILIHGYTGSYKDTRMAKIKDAYLSTGRFNVIQVDWEILAAPPCYIRVTHHSRFVGETVAKFIDGLYLIGLNMSLVHVVGFSLGAQVAGFAGNLVALGKICRITGLDPALPLFLNTDSSGHLDKSDADFVDVIHTCGGILAMLDPVGHVDFYPNGGSRQPGCEFSNLKCSHSRAPQYFAESVSSKKKFAARLCSSWEVYVSGTCNSSVTSFMGEPCSIRSEHGKYYLTTRSKEPFGG